MQNTCYATACRFNKLEFKDVNPYAPGEAREDWDPTTGTRKQAKKTQNQPKGQSQPKAGPSSSSRPPPAKPQRQSGYKGSNFDPNYSQRYRERSHQEKKGEEKRDPKK